MRQATLHVTYNGRAVTNSFADSNLDFTYTDAPSGELDDITIRMVDMAGNWRGKWIPAEGDQLQIAIEVMDWQKHGDGKRKHHCGSFLVDSVTVQGPPDIVEIRAASYPVSSDSKQQKRSKVWEKVKLSTIANDIAQRAKLKLISEVAIDPTYDRIEQQEQTDFAFLLDLSTKEGIALKVTDGKLVMFDEARFERGKPVAIYRPDDGLLLDYSFEWSSANCAYGACEITYEETEKASINDDTKKETGKKKKGRKKTVKKSKKVTYVPPGAPKTGPILRIKESAGSQAEALRIARNRLREQNKQANRASITVLGDIRIASSVVVVLDGLGRFSSRYIVDSVTHQIGSSGYTSRLEIRKVLGW
ncbi:phage late control D family protein [Paenibacillus alvei]|uniref:phage late control D family protein n=1 Tax=Paenibacillus alvei TaxID=44250 RepID=UPI0013DC0B95|nr:contractile injection system protein, VgrG/Pvc8 family [Paenibacillus alvei]NEZ43726.1 late control protein [Paenibacillus alvei]